MPRAKRPLCNRQFLVALIPHRGAAGWICCINNSIPFQRKPGEGEGICRGAFHDRSVPIWAQAGGIFELSWSGFEVTSVPPCPAQDFSFQFGDVVPPLLRLTSKE